MDAFSVLCAWDPDKQRRDVAKNAPLDGRAYRCHLKQKQRPSDAVSVLCARDSANTYCEFNRS
jgi:hypothetical protein